MVIFQPGDIILSRTRNIISFLIRRETLSRWSHCRVMINSTEFIEATFPRVRIGKISELTGKYIVMRPVVPLREAQLQILKLYLLSQIGRRYGWLSIVNMMLKYQLFTGSQPTCAMITAIAYVRAGMPLLRCDDHWIAPEDIHQSIVLVEVV